MPFTFSHPAVVLPLLALPKKWRSATGLVLGSMMPDFEKFIRMSEHDPYSHTWRSLFYFNLPLGLLLAFVFHGVVRDALILHLPAALRERFVPFVGFRWVAYFRKHYVLVILSVLVGAVSHIIWDSFTHPEGRGVRLFPFLLEPAFEGWFTMRLFSFLQKLGSVVGAFVVVFYILQLPRQPWQRGSNGQQMKYWLLLAAVSFLVMLSRVVLQDSVRVHNLYHLTIVGLSAGLTSLILTPILLRSWSALQKSAPVE